MNRKNDAPSNKRTMKKRWIVLGIVLIIVVLGAIVVGVIANKNVKAMNSCVDSVFETLKYNYNVKALDVGEYENMTVYGLMKFDVEQYHIEELGEAETKKFFGEVFFGTAAE